MDTGFCAGIHYLFGGKEMENDYKIVDFEFCNTCKHKDVPQADDPCHDCLGEPVNLYSHRPVNYEEDAKLKKGE